MGNEQDVVSQYFVVPICLSDGSIAENRGSLHRELSRAESVADNLYSHEERPGITYAVIYYKELNNRRRHLLYRADRSE